MSRYLDTFPKVAYTLSQDRYSKNYDMVTNVFFRVSVIKETLKNASSYYVYRIKEGDRPDTLAEQIYKSSEAHWVIMYANEIVDPLYDWPLNNRDFENHIVSKYGSVANAKTAIHHYEKVIERTETVSGTVTTTKYVIDYNTKTDGIITLSDVNGSYTPSEAVYIGANLESSTFSANVVSFSSGNGKMVLANTVGQIIRYNTLNGDSSGANGSISTVDYPTVPYDYYLSLPDEQSIVNLTINGKLVVEKTYRNSVSVYDYELELNEKKREIKIIKPEYYFQIVSELATLTNSVNAQSFIRKLT